MNTLTKKQRKILNTLKKGRVAYKSIGRGVRKGALSGAAGKPGKFLFSKNPYRGKPGFANKAKYVGVGAAKLAPPLGAIRYGSSLTDPEQKQAMEKDAVSSKYISKRIRGATLKEMLAVLGLPLKIKAAQKYNSKFDRVFQRLEDARNLERLGVK